jgi:hypothetical protein
MLNHISKLKRAIRSKGLLCIIKSLSNKNIISKFDNIYFNKIVMGNVGDENHLKFNCVIINDNFFFSSFFFLIK